MRPLAHIREVTPSSQAKKSSLEVRTGICVAVSNALREEVTGKAGVGGAGDRGKGFII